MSDPLPPVPQSHYDAERERFNAESYGMDIDRLEKRCPHNAVKRITATEVQCMSCHMGWIDQGRFILDGTTLKGIK